MSQYTKTLLASNTTLNDWYNASEENKLALDKFIRDLLDTACNTLQVAANLGSEIQVAEFMNRCARIKALNLDID